MFADTDTFRINERSYDMRESGGEAILYPVDEASTSAIVAIDDVGLYLLSKAVAGCSFAEIAHACASDYGVEEPRVRSDAFHFFDHLVNIGVMLKAGGS